MHGQRCRAAGRYSATCSAIALREAVDEPLPPIQAAAPAERLGEPGEALLAGLLGVHLDGELLTDEVAAHDAQVMPELRADVLDHAVVRRGGGA